MAVEIQYTLKNTGKKTASPRLTIYGSLFGWEGVDSTYPDKAFLELRVTIDQKPIKTTTNVMALYQGEPVNAKLSSLHLDPLWIARNPDPLIETSSLSQKSLRAAIQEGLIRDLGQGLVPNWYALASHSWSTSVAPQRKGRLALSYQLRPAYEPLQLNEVRLANLLNEHCTNTEQLKEQIKALGRSAPESVVALRYVIPTGLGTARMPPSTSLEFLQEKTWAGLKPMLSFSCTSNGHAAIGRPAFSQEVSSPTGQALSILVLLPQE